MAVLTGMVAGAMVFSSFVISKGSKTVVTTNYGTSNKDWRTIGIYYGYCDDCYYKRVELKIWEKEGTCGAYYWVYNDTSNSWDKNPDETSSNYSGALRKNSNNQWYASVKGDIYILKDF